MQKQSWTNSTLDFSAKNLKLSVLSNVVWNGHKLQNQETYGRNYNF